VKIHRDPGRNFVLNQNTKVCSLNFTVDDYICGAAMNSKRRVLKATAVPAIFPWTSEKHITMDQHSDIVESVEEHKSQHLMMVPWNLNPMIMICQKLNANVNSCNRRLKNYKLTLLKRNELRSQFCFENFKYDDEMVRFVFILKLCFSIRMKCFSLKVCGHRVSKHLKERSPIVVKKDLVKEGF